ncbi:hypothetical protein AAG570_014089 [Ranatra chinensis]|uniref:Uncharacterized protein n=1 Tax=Ranatra chinensis TaxID=642074 RepID=A0ABD0XU29_9HEMI
MLIVFHVTTASSDRRTQSKRRQTTGTHHTHHHCAPVGHPRAVVSQLATFTLRECHQWMISLNKLTSTACTPPAKSSHIPTAPRNIVSAPFRDGKPDTKRIIVQPSEIDLFSEVDYKKLVCKRQRKGSEEEKVKSCVKRTTAAAQQRGRIQAAPGQGSPNDSWIADSPAAMTTGIGKNGTCIICILVLSGVWGRGAAASSGDVITCGVSIPGVPKGSSNQRGSGHEKKPDGTTVGDTPGWERSEREGRSERERGEAARRGEGREGRSVRERGEAARRGEGREREGKERSEGEGEE